VKSRIHHYETEQIDVSYDIPRCIHAEECIKRLSAVFDAQKRPWIQPAFGSPDAVAETIHHCPSGALHYVRKDSGGSEPIPETNTITLTTDGALYIRGDITIRASDGTVLLQDTRVALCRCGASENKPLCDNSHRQIHFQAAAPNPQPDAAPPPSSSGAITIEPTHNGSLLVTGNFSIVDETGQPIFRGTEAWLCRCGGSGDKPFCDSTHKKNGFQTD